MTDDCAQTQTHVQTPPKDMPQPKTQEVGAPVNLAELPPFSISTSTTKPVAAGDVRIEVHDDSIFQIGMTVQIGSGATAERRLYIRKGSLILDTPLSNSHPVGTTVQPVLLHTDLHINTSNAATTGSRRAPDSHSGNVGWNL